ncbi:FeoA family protein [Lamprobacter modestohalophilus]|uniref:FeoA family protein n=1 Tax=Lamprobacter modestohalophilus TaxID=1064514 RepID=UPI002ADEABCA|nr:FeoA family protein [Lamprobacter modestohalophilus]MEA1048729.1 FeoA family protein [Lamprobacter modestohalophilus]
MDQPVSTPLTLTQLPVGSSAVITQILGGQELHRKLRGFGIRLGTPVRIAHRRGSGLVVSVGNTRVALGGGIVEKLLITPIHTDESPESGASG